MSGAVGDGPAGDGAVGFVTGAARGVGRAAALVLAEAGVDVAVADLGDGSGYRTLDYDLAGRPELEETAAKVQAAGRRALAVELDVRDRPAVPAAVTATEAALGPITHLVLAAGVVSGVPVHQMGRDQWDEVVDTNLTGAFNVMKAVVPAMVDRGRGSVVLVCGTEARRGVGGGLSHASAAGWALIGMAKAVAMEVAASGVTVNVVATGPVASEPLRSSRSFAAALAGVTHPLGRPWVEADEVAEAIGFLAAGASRAMTGAVLDVDLGLAGRNSA